MGEPATVWEEYYGTTRLKVKATPKVIASCSKYALDWRTERGHLRLGLGSSDRLLLKDCIRVTDATLIGKVLKVEVCDGEMYIEVEMKGPMREHLKHIKEVHAVPAHGNYFAVKHFVLISDKVSSK